MIVNWWWVGGGLVMGLLLLLLLKGWWWVVVGGGLVVGLLVVARFGVFFDLFKYLHCQTSQYSANTGTWEKHGAFAFDRPSEISKSGEKIVECPIRFGLDEMQHVRLLPVERPRTKKEKHG